MRICACVGGGHGDVNTDAFDRASLQVYLEPHISPEDNLTAVRDPQVSRDEVQVWEGQVTWLEWGSLPLEGSCSPAVLCSLGCQDDTAPWKCFKDHCVPGVQD